MKQIRLKDKILIVEKCADSCPLYQQDIMGDAHEGCHLIDSAYSDVPPADCPLEDAIIPPHTTTTLWHSGKKMEVWNGGDVNLAVDAGIFKE